MIRLVRWGVVGLLGVVAVSLLAGCDEGGDTGYYEGYRSGECRDGIDNDRDGATDCDDPSCVRRLDCAGADADADADDGGEPTASCEVIRWCETCCFMDDVPCKAACLALGGPEAGVQWSAFETCVEDGSCVVGEDCGRTYSEECMVCAMVLCRPQFDACEGGAAGTGGCNVLRTCLADCGTPTFAGTAASCPFLPALGCVAACHQAADADAFILVRALQACAFSGCYFECVANDSRAACNECLAIFCGAELAACSGDR